MQPADHAPLLLHLQSAQRKVKCGTPDRAGPSIAVETGDCSHAHSAPSGLRIGTGGGARRRIDGSGRRFVPAVFQCMKRSMLHVDVMSLGLRINADANDTAAAQQFNPLSQAGQNLSFEMVPSPPISPEDSAGVGTASTYICTCLSQMQM